MRESIAESRDVVIGNHIFAGFAGLCVIVSGLFAADFWERKNFLDWSEKEVAEMLSHSPWAKFFTVA